MFWVRNRKRRIPVGIYMFKVDNRNTRTRCEICWKLTIKTPERWLASFWCLYCSLLTYFTPCSSVSIVNFEQVNNKWDSKLSQSSKMELFAIIVNGWKLLTLFTKSSILHVWQGFQYTSDRKYTGQIKSRINCGIIHLVHTQDFLSPDTNTDVRNLSFSDNFAFTIDGLCLWRVYEIFWRFWESRRNRVKSGEKSLWQKLPFIKSKNYGQDQISQGWFFLIF